MADFAKTVLVDTGFWYALYDKRDDNYEDAQTKQRYLESANILIPWPSLYETLNSRFAKSVLALRSFEALLRQTHVKLLADEPYRDSALKACFQTALVRSRPLALVDVVIRLILEDGNVRKHGLLTFNQGDFKDVCTAHRIEML